MGVLYCVVLYCIALYCVVLCCVVLCCIVLYCIVLYCNFDNCKFSEILHPTTFYSMQNIIITRNDMNDTASRTGLASLSFTYFGMKGLLCLDSTLQLEDIEC